MDNEPDNKLAQSFVDGSYAFKGAVLSIDPKVFLGPDSALHAQVLIDASTVGIPTETRGAAPSRSEPPEDPERALFVHKICMRPDSKNRLRLTVVVGMTPPR